MAKSFQSDENKTKNWLLNQFNIHYNGENILNLSRKKSKKYLHSFMLQTYKN